MNECDNVDHDWENRYCYDCNLPVKQYTGKEAVKMMGKIRKTLTMDCESK